MTSNPTTNPGPPSPDQLEQQLRELTAWKGEPMQLWEQALRQAPSSAAAGSPRNLKAILDKPIGGRLFVALAACFALVCVAAVLMPSLGKARSTKSPKVDPVISASAEQPTYATMNSLRSESPQEWRESSQSPVESVAIRHVIQKATIELQTDDVRAAFAKASHLISPASGEFVETSSLTGDGKSAQGNLTLRVAAPRLSEVLNELREFGQVQSENTTGEDVTSQVVDLEARIRNEQRIERELLELLDKRADAPLKDVLELRSSLSDVRQAIEQYIAQRDRLGRMVALASILVVIRGEPEASKPQPAETNLTYFKHSVATAWQRGLRTAVDSVSWLVGVLVSGMMWWVILACVAVAIHRYRHRLAARCV